MKRLANVDAANGIIDGVTAFELYDTYGFPVDLTRLIASEKGLKLDETGFDKALQTQKERGRADAKKITGDWIEIINDKGVDFVGYDVLEAEGINLVKHRTVTIKDKPQYQLVLDKTPFYAEGGGQVGDTGFLWFGEERIKVLDTKRENELVVHIVDKLPTQVNDKAKAKVNDERRQLIENNHTATHLLHAALREILGDHVHQKGSLVNGSYLRFDFSHYQKVSADEMAQIEAIVNAKVRQNIPLQEDRSIPIAQAKSSGAQMLFGEKYGEHVRMITFDPNYSIELCGGCHVDATGQIGLLKIISEGAVAAGVRRVEAYTALKAQEFVNKELEELNSIRGLFKNPVHTLKNVYSLQEENKTLKKQLDDMIIAQVSNLQEHLVTHFENVNGVNFLAEKLSIGDSKAIKTMAYNLERQVGNALIVFGFVSKGKPQIMVTVSEPLTKEDYLHAGKIVKELAADIKGGGGGQAFFATAGGTDARGIENALAKAKSLI